MFDIAWTELLLVAVVAIIVVGPKELPGMLRAFGKTFGQVRRTAREFQSTFNDALREAERDAKLDDVRKDIDSFKSMNPAKDLSKSLNETKAALDKTVSGASGTADSVVPLKRDGNGAAEGGEVAAPSAVVADKPAAVPTAPDAAAPSAPSPPDSASPEKTAEGAR